LLALSKKYNQLDVLRHADKEEVPVDGKVGKIFPTKMAFLLIFIYAQFAKSALFMPDGCLLA
jgi:hypothetical protein